MTLLQAECHESSEAVSLLEVSSFYPPLANDLFFIDAQLKFTWLADKEEDADKEEEKEEADDHGNINAIRMENAGLYIDRNALLSNEVTPSALKLFLFSFFGIPFEHLTPVMDRTLACGRRLAERPNLPYIICMKLQVHCHLLSSAEVSAVKYASSKLFLHRELTSIKIPDDTMEDSAEHRATPCSICLEDMAAGTLATEMACLHCFHHRCISAWLAKNSSCPLCRQPGKRMAVSIGNELVAYLR